MAFHKYGKYIFPTIAMIFSIDVLVPSISPLQIIPSFQKGIECDDYIIEETVRRYIDDGIRAQNTQANSMIQSIIGHTTERLDRSNPLWNMVGKTFEGLGQIAENTTKAQNFIAFSSFESKEVSNSGGIKKCRIMANSVSNRVTGGGEYVTHNYMVSIRGNQVTID